MYDIIPLVVALLALIIIIFIVIRRLPQLAILDVENMPEEKAIKVKDEIVQKRLARDILAFFKRFAEVGKFLKNTADFTMTWLNKLRQLKAQHEAKKAELNISRDEKIKMLMAQAEELIKKEDLEDLKQAEAKLIEVVSLDKKNFSAFMDLADIYWKLKKNFEAKQTYQYCLRLLDFKDDKAKEAEINYSLSLVNTEIGNLDEARANIIESLKIEPNNPRFLNIMLELCVDLKDKVVALDVLERLKEANPENQSLEDWQEKINSL
ncbi:MAG: hypothetical protein WCK37_04830 [Candidatus Falkowbacteria bacterium]